ncbi:MAG: hypothetical protein TV41_02270 [Wolbachia endosymbiont of Dactylopius coccus]|nr:MAG: hypothetical protein TV41_02270 [Wolbachia endosymbiont of Dactylopius coccus]
MAFLPLLSICLPCNGNWYHSGKYCYGKTPMQTFLDSKHIAFQKNISNIKTETDISFNFVDSSVS